MVLAATSANRPTPHPESAFALGEGHVADFDPRDVGDRVERPRSSVEWNAEDPAPGALCAEARVVAAGSRHIAMRMVAER